MSSKPTNRIALRDAREEAIQLITNRFAEGILDEEELESRLELTEDATTLDELRDLTTDIRGPGEPEGSAAIVPVTAAPLAAADGGPQGGRAIAVFGENKLQGHWTPGRKNRGVAVFGESTIDFREARLGPGVTTVQVTAVLGSVVVIVPPELAVESSCIPILGSVEFDDTVNSSSDPAEPRLRLTGAAFLGSIEVREQLPGESRRDAKRRLRDRRKQLKAMRKRARKQLKSPDEPPLLTNGDRSQR